MDDSPRATPHRLYVVVGILTGAVLLYTVVEQLVDANYQVLWEVTNILAGDRPYRDFYVTGWPLQTAVSLAMQWLVGYRLIGEFLTQWTLLLAGVLMGFHLALRLSRSVPASLGTIAVTLLCLASTPTLHFPKLFFYPLAVVIAWQYLDGPGARPAVMAGLLTAVAFLFRHDHGVYIGVAFVCAFVLARLATPSSRTPAAIVRDASAYAAAAAFVLAPWAVLVHWNEGLPAFVRTRAEWGAVWAPPPGSPFDVLRDLAPGRISRFLAGEDGLTWLMQVTLLLPMLMLGSVAFELLARRRRPLMTPETCVTILLAGLSIFVMSRLGREESYYVAVLPLSTALGARLLAESPAPLPETSRRAVAWARRGWHIARRTIGVSALLITAVVAFGRLDRDLFSPNELGELRLTYRHLFSSPPIDAYQPAEEAQETDWAGWEASGADARQAIMIRYMHDCTRDGDRIVVTGSTPYHVGYYAERPLAGGQMQWHHRWRSDPAHEAQALALIRRESVPFVFSTHDPVLDDFKAYPGISAYLNRFYVEVAGTGGLLLADRRRQPTGRFGKLGFPCFR